MDALKEEIRLGDHLSLTHAEVMGYGKGIGSILYGPWLRRKRTSPAPPPVKSKPASSRLAFTLRFLWIGNSERNPAPTV
jgi:hypothetical protein